MLKVVIVKKSISYDISQIIEKIVWSGRKGAAPRSFKISFLDDDGDYHKRINVDVEEGDQVICYENGKEIFRGLIVRQEQSSNKVIDLLAYDNMFYFANNKDSFSYEQKTATQIFNDLIARSGMQVGEVADTGYIIPSLPKAKTTYYDVILDALSSTFKSTGIRYYVSSESGRISLRRRKENTLLWVLEHGANVISYSYSKSIEKIKTRIKLLSKQDTVVGEKSNEALEAKIGKFIDIESVDDSLNQGELEERVKAVLDEKGTPSKSLSVNAIGVTEAIAGACVYVIIPHAGIQRAFYIDEDVHTFSGNTHTMNLKLNFADDISKI